MNINTVAGQMNYGKTEKTAANHTTGTNGAKATAKNNSNFYESLSGSLYGQGAEEAGTPINTKGQKNDRAAERTTIIDTSYQYQSVTSSVRIQKNGMFNAKAVILCSARNISYAESDYVKTYVEEGFAYKAKVDITGHCIYIEEKQENGTVKGYEVDYDKLEKDTDNPIEQIALEAWKMANRAMQGEKPFFKKVNQEELLPDSNAATQKDAAENKSIEDMTIEEALCSFYDFIQERIKDGPPKYAIGNQEFSVEEWEKLLEGVDEQMDEIREQMREEIAKRLEEAEQKAVEQKEIEQKEIEQKEAEQKGIEKETAAQTVAQTAKTEE